jgi:hypothetical protein
MSVQKQFVRIGEIGLALLLWKLILSNPKFTLLMILIFILSVFSINIMLDDKGKTFYVNVNKLELLDSPFGDVKMELEMNDSLTFVSEMNDNWNQVCVESDTLYFKENLYKDTDLGYTYKIQKTPFTKWKALKGKSVILRHPNGYFEYGNSMFKNGELVEVIEYSESDHKIKFKDSSIKFGEISADYIEIDWVPILQKYPKIVSK